MMLMRLLTSILLVACLSACSADGDDSEPYDGKDTAVRPHLAQEDGSEQDSGKDSTSGTQLAEADGFQRYSDKEYKVVRLQLVESGYELAHIEQDMPLHACPGGEPCETFPEMITCSGTGLAFCSFGFRNKEDGRCIRVTTYGETRPKIHKIFEASEADKEDIGMDCK